MGEEKKAEEPAAPAKEGEAPAEEQPAAPAEETPEAPKEEEKEPPKPQVKSIKLELNITSKIVGALNPETLENYVTQEFDLALIDKKERERQDAKNLVEEFVYDRRDKLSTIYSEFATDPEKEKI